MSSPESAPGSTASLRTANQRRVLDLLRTHGGDGTQSPSAGSSRSAGAAAGPPGTEMTQAELARATGLAPATVSNIVRDLAAAGLVATDPGSGRRGTRVRLAPDAGVVAGIDVGHTHLAVAVGDLTGHVLAEDRLPLDPDHASERALDQAGDMLVRVLGGLDLDLAAVRTVGMGLPAPITDGVVRSSAILPGWVGVNAQRAAEQHFARPVHLENDANLGALAEHRIGGARGHSTSIFLKLSSGVGAGIVLDGRLFRGADGTAGEVGHLTIDDQGPVCRCGSRGCLETYASTGSVLELMATQLPGASFDEVVGAARVGNLSALRSFEDAGLHLGWALATLANLMNPSVLVVGGDLARAGDLLLDSARVALRRHALHAVAATPVVASALADRASLLGALLLAADGTDLLIPG